MRANTEPVGLVEILSRCCSMLLVLQLLYGCGFHLRGSVNLPPQMQAVFIEGVSANEQFSLDFAEAIRLSGGRVVSEKKEAKSILRIIAQRFDRRAISLSESGLVNEYALVYLLDFEVASPDGHSLLSRQSIEVVRDYFDNQQQVLGTSQQQSVIREEIYKEAARTVLRRAELSLTR